MSLQFSRSLRILRVDTFRAARIGMLFAILLMAGLLAWFFLAKVTLYENSTSFKFRDDGRIQASFSEEGLQRIRMGQAALVRLNMGPDQQQVTLPAAVYDLPQGSDQVELVAMTNEIPSEALSGKASGRVEVEVESLTPAQLVIRATGKVLKQADLPDEFFSTPNPLPISLCLCPPKVRHIYIAMERASFSFPRRFLLSSSSCLPYTLAVTWSICSTPNANTLRDSGFSSSTLALSPSLSLTHSTKPLSPKIGL